MNYIKHLSAFYEKVYFDYRLNPSHVSLYMALFQFWNLNRFENPVSINRYQAMKLSKIGSTHTYHKCLHDLHNYGYIIYQPSFNPLKGSLVNLCIFDTSSEQVVHSFSSKSDTGTAQALLPSFHPTLDQVSAFFKTENYPEPEVQKFFNHYQSNGWKIAGKTPMEDWQASAHKWMLNTQSFAPKAKPVSTNLNKNKKYDIPL